MGPLCSGLWHFLPPIYRAATHTTGKSSPWYGLRKAWCCSIITLIARVWGLDVKRARRELKRKLGKEHVIRDMRRHEAAVRPGERRRGKHGKSIRAQRKAEANA